MNTALDNMFFEFDETECVMAATGEDAMEESTIDSEVKEIEKDDEDDYYDETIEDFGMTFTMEDTIVNEFRQTRDHGMDSIREEMIDENIMGIDPEVEEIEDDDEDDCYNDYGDAWEDY